MVTMFWVVAMVFEMAIRMFWVVATVFGENSYGLVSGCYSSPYCVWDTC